MDLVNPLMTEIANLSPGAQQALVHAHTAMGGPGAATHAATTPAPTPSLQPPSAPSTPMMGASAPPNLGEPNAPMLTGHHGTSLTLSHTPDSAPPPTMSAPSAPPMPFLAPPTAPSASPPIRGTEAGDQIIRSEALKKGAGIDQIHSKIENSQFGQNHPTLGKIAGWGAEIPLHVLEAAGSMLGPTRTAEMLLPGTTAHHAMELRNLNSQIGHEAEENLKGAQAGAENARTGLEEAQTAGLPEHESDTHALTQSEITEHNAQAANLLHPQAKTAFEAWQAQNPGHPIEEWLKAQQANKNVRPDTPEQQYIDEYQQKHQGASIAEAERQYTLDTQRPPQVAPILMMAPNANGTSTAEVVRPGQTVTPGTTTASGCNSESVTASKQEEAAKKAQAEAHKESQIAQRLAANPSPTNDVALLMHFIGATKPDSLSKLRLNQNEVSLVLGTRSSFGDLEALAEKVQNGQKLTPQQRTDMLTTMKLIAGGDAGGGEPLVQHSPSTGQYRYSTDGGKTWQPGQPPSK